MRYQTTFCVVLVLLLLVFAPAVVAQEVVKTNAGATVEKVPGALVGNIKGRVLKKSDGSGIFGAAIGIRGTTRSTRSDKEGNYTFAGIEANRDYVLEISKAPLYDDGQTTVNVSPDTDNTAQDVGLKRKSSNTDVIAELRGLLASQDFDGLESKLEFLSERCKGEKDEFCESIVTTKKMVEKKKLREVNTAFDRMP